jgi:hypothetical protein
LTTTAHNNADCSFAIAHIARNCGAKRRVVNAFGGVRTVINNGVSSLRQHSNEVLFKFKSSVVRANGNDAR